MYVCTKFEVDRSFRSKVIRGPKFRPAADPFPGAQDRQNLISWRWSLPAPIQFGGDRWTQFRVIVVTDTARPPVRHKHRPPHTHRQDRLQYTAPLSLARSVKRRNVVCVCVCVSHSKGRSLVNQVYYFSSTLQARYHNKQ